MPPNPHYWKNDPRWRLVYQRTHEKELVREESWIGRLDQAPKEKPAAQAYRSGDKCWATLEGADGKPDKIWLRVTGPEPVA